jgi:hypothetical protein
MRRTGIPAESEKEFLKGKLVCDFMPKINQFSVDNARGCGKISSPPVE